MGSITFFISHLIDTIFDKFFLFVYSTRNLKKDQICKSGPFINAYATFFPAAIIAYFVYDFASDVYLLPKQGASLYVYVSSCGRYQFTHSTFYRFRLTLLFFPNSLCCIQYLDRHNNSGNLPQSLQAN